MVFGGAAGSGAGAGAGRGRRAWCVVRGAWCVPAHCSSHIFPAATTQESVGSRPSLRPALVPAASAAAVVSSALLAWWR